MNKVDKVYIDLLNNIVETGVEKNTRAGDVYSVFGRQLRFDLKEGFPLLTTKKVFMKGITHELLWFLQRPYNSHGSMNIEYLVRNGVHIWDDDAYRWFKEWVDKHIIEPVNMDYVLFVCTNDDEKEKKQPSLEYWIENESKGNNLEWLLNISKDEFIDLTLQKVEIQLKNTGLLNGKVYRFGDLGPIYGTQWRAFGNGIFRKKENDQIQRIIETLKTNPNDRRMLCVAFNPGQLDNMALPPCHVMFQFYTRELKTNERWELYRQRYKDEPYDSAYCKPHLQKYGDAMSYFYNGEHDDELENEKIPKYGLSCMWVQRSVDVCCGLPFNIASYALLTHIIAYLTNMIPDELVGSLGDCHIYKNHLVGVEEQVSRDGCDTLPVLKIMREVRSIEDFKYDDLKIFGYKPDPPIKYQLNVG